MIKSGNLQIVSPSEDIKIINVLGHYLRKYGNLRTTWRKYILLRLYMYSVLVSFLAFFTTQTNLVYQKQCSLNFNEFTYFFQILFLSGLAFVIGLERTFRFFFQYHKIKGSTAFFGGIFVVLFGYPLIGMIIEAYGFIVLFSGFFPVAINFLRRIPVIGTILNLPGISSVSFLMIYL